MPLGAALRAWLDGRRDAVLTVHVEGGDDELLPVADSFRAPDAFEPWERAALDACRGRVLDVGAGAGCHALALQEEGHEVLALDACPEAVRVMGERGVRDARVGTPGELPEQDRSARGFDTILLLQHGAGLGGDLEGLAELLSELIARLAPGGALIIDSADPSAAQDGPEEDSPLAGVPASEIGSAWLTLSFDGVRGAPYPWLFLSERALRALAEGAGLTAERLWADDHGRYVLRLLAD